MGCSIFKDSLTQVVGLKNAEIIMLIDQFINWERCPYIYEAKKWFKQKLDHFLIKLQKKFNICLSTLKNHLRELKESGILIVQKFKKSNGIHTCYYSLDYVELENLGVRLKGEKVKQAKETEKNIEIVQKAMTEGLESLKYSKFLKENLVGIKLSKPVLFKMFEYPEYFKEIIHKCNYTFFKHGERIISKTRYLAKSIYNGFDKLITLKQEEITQLENIKCETANEKIFTIINKINFDLERSNIGGLCKLKHKSCVHYKYLNYNFEIIQIAVENHHINILNEWKERNQYLIDQLGITSLHFQELSSNDNIRNNIYSNENKDIRVLGYIDEI